MADVLDYLIEAVRRNIQTRPIRWALVLVLGALWVIFAAFTFYATFDTLSRTIFGAA